MFTRPRNLMRYLFNTKTALPYEKETSKAIIILCIIILLFVCAVSASGHELFMQNTKIIKIELLLDSFGCCQPHKYTN
jgi:hypothetical protein